MSRRKRSLEKMIKRCRTRAHSVTCGCSEAEQAISKEMQRPREGLELPLLRFHGSQVSPRV